MNIIEDDERPFSLVENHQNKADDVDGGDTKENVHHHHEQLSKSTLKEPAIVEIAKVNYRDVFIGIYTDGARRFFHDPIVLLDLGSIVSESNELLKTNLVRFNIKMWDAELRSKLLDRLRSLHNTIIENIHQDDIYVLPFEEVQLTVEPGSLINAAVLRSKPIRYGRLSESLRFQFECASPAVAVELAENLKKNPELFLKEWQLALECRGLALGTNPINGPPPKKIKVERPTWLFNVSALPCEAEIEGYDKEKVEENVTTCVPVFSVVNCTNPAAISGQSLGFSSFVMDAKTKNVDFDLSTGIFTVKTAGNYQLNFTGHVYSAIGLPPHRLNLKVNGKVVATSLNQSSVETGGYQTAVISTLLPLKTGDKIGIFASVGTLYQDSCYKARFYGILFSD